MMIEWFKAREATEIGRALADAFAEIAGSTGNVYKSGQRNSLESVTELLKRADRDVRPLRLNFFKRAKLANSFKWRLLENGVKPDVVDEVTERLVMHLSQPKAPAQANPS